MQACDGPPDETDRGQVGVYDHDEDDLQTNVIEQLPLAGQAPVYPGAPTATRTG